MRCRPRWSDRRREPQCASLASTHGHDAPGHGTTSIARAGLSDLRDGAARLDAAAREQPDLIVSDVNMPGMGGVDMVRPLRTDQRTAGSRVLMLTSEGSVERETEGLAAGADDYILKARRTAAPYGTRQGAPGAVTVSNTRSRADRRRARRKKPPVLR
jgi:CheY-like chemotaxis protein